MTTAPEDPRFVRIAVQGTDLAAVFALGDSAPSLTSGYDGWAEQQRGRRRALLVFQGPPVWSQDVPVAIDAFGEDRGEKLAGVRRQLQLLRALYALPHPGASPPLATLAGKTLWLTDEHDVTANWALRGMTQTQEPQRDNDTGEVVQWIGTLSFSQSVARDVLRITSGPNAGMRIHVVKPSETLASIARAEHVKVSLITRADGSKIRDPKRVKVGDRLRLPRRTTA